MFDPNTFISATYAERTSTEYVPVPEGEYAAQIADVKARAIRGKDGEERVVLDVVWQVNDEEVSRHTGRETNTVRQSIFLDMTPAGTLDNSRGRNVQLGRLREAVDQNKEGKPWAIRDLIGAVACIRVEHRSGDNGEIYANVTGVTRL